MFDVTCLDADGNLITNLTQWDLNRTLVIKDSGLDVAPEFHFCNRNSKEALRVSSLLKDGTLVVKIPNVLLQEGMTIIAYLYAYESEISGKTITTIRIPVRPRPKPSDYKYIENIEYITAQRLEQKLDTKFEEINKVISQLENMTAIAESGEIAAVDLYENADGVFEFKFTLPKCAYIGEEEPSENVAIWIDTSEEYDELKGVVSIPLTIQGYMEGGNDWCLQNTDRELSKCSGYVEIPSGYKYIKANVDINQYGWAVLFSTANESGQITDPTISVLGKNQDGVYDYLVEIPNDAKYVFVSSYSYSESNYAYFTNEDTEKNTVVDVFDRTEFSLFKQWGIVGDSLSVGHTTDMDGNASSPNLYYSWGQYLARRIGNTCLNFGRSGVSAKEWMSDSNGYNLLIQEDKLCQCYILALGANDTGYTLGSIDDVDFVNMNNNADTEYGWYARVINSIRTTAPQAPIFMFTLPYPRNTDANIQAINRMIREFAQNDNFSNVYLVDLDADYNDYFNSGKLGNCIGNTGWHLTPLGYLYASIVNEIALSKVMEENYADFQNVFKIPYGVEEEISSPTKTEVWTFELEDGSTVTKQVVIA